MPRRRLRGDVLDQLAGDESVEVVALAIEGVADGRRLVEAVERVAERIPVVALKTGRTDVDAFSRSHTGALTGSWRVTRSALAQAGAVVVDDLTQLVDAARALRARSPAGRTVPESASSPARPGRGFSSPTSSASTACACRELPRRSVRLGDLLPPITFQRNPVDTGRPAETFGAVLETVAGAHGIDLVAVYLLDEPDAVDLVGCSGPRRRRRPCSR